MEKIPTAAWFIWLSIAIYIIYYKLNEEKIKKLELEKSLKKEQELKTKKASEIQNNIEKADSIKIKLSEIQKLKIINVSDYKEVIIDNEKIIIDKGGNELLFNLLKIDTFLKEYRDSIVNDKKFLTEDVFKKIDELKLTISKNNNESGQAGHFIEISKIEAKNSINKLHNLSHITVPVFENRIKNLEYYKNLGIAMIVFYLNDKKIFFYEIYEAFERLGVFDSSWQKSISNKLDNIENQLAQISDQLTELNQNFTSLVESSEKIVHELKEINSSIITNNLLQAITAYQTWKINKNTKELSS